MKSCNYHKIKKNGTIYCQSDVPFPWSDWQESCQYYVSQVEDFNTNGCEYAVIWIIYNQMQK